MSPASWLGGLPAEKCPYDEEARDTHRGWLIEENWLGQWEATHPDFDGPEDNRSVTGKTRADVIAEVDEWILEHSA